MARQLVGAALAPADPDNQSRGYSADAWTGVSCWRSEHGSRRRAFAGGRPGLRWGCVAAAVGVAVAVRWHPSANTGHDSSAGFEAGKPQVVPPTPKPDGAHRPRATQVRAIVASTSSRPPSTAGTWTRPGDSTARAARGDDARGVGAAANIPVVPFQASDVAEVQVDARLLVRARSRDQDRARREAARQARPARSSRWSCRPSAPARTAHWLVASWVPLGGGDGSQPRDPAARAQTRSRERRSRSGRGLALLPIGLIVGRSCSRRSASASRGWRAARPRRARLQLELEPVVGQLEPVRRAAARPGGASAAAAARRTPRTRRPPRPRPGARAGPALGVRLAGASPRRGRGRRRGRARQRVARPRVARVGERRSRSPATRKPKASSS